MKRTRQWWGALTPNERSELHWLEKYNSKWSNRGSAYLPDDCTECGNCNSPHSGVGLCPICTQRLDKLINKADSHQQYN